MLSSQLEIKIHELLEDLDIPFEEEYVFNDLTVSNGKHLRFDFAIFDDSGELECLIEAQGIQHYQARSKFGGKKGLYRQKYNDNLKRQYCLNHNLKLRYIPYTDEYRLNENYIMNLIYG